MDKRSGKVYTPIDTVKCERLVKELASKAMQDKNLYPSASAMEVEIFAVFKRPKKENNTYCQKYPDIDNLVKTVLDGMNTIAYIDDKQVVSLKVKKMFTQKHLNLDDYTVIIVRELELP